LLVEVDDEAISPDAERLFAGRIGVSYVGQIISTMQNAAVVR
jgi:hypothetical protein